MTRLEINNNFAIDKNSGTGLTKQLRGRLGEFIQKNPAGTQLPPERELAEALEISRVTVRGALKYFFDKGLIVREGRRGTFLADISKSFAEIHPMQIGYSFAASSVINLKLLSFETNPQQRVFWRKAVDMFNTGNSAIKVEIEELPQSVSHANYPRYILENGPDIIMHQYESHMLDMFADVPEELIELLESDDFLFDDPGKLRYRAIPIKSATALLCWNKELAEQIGLKNISDRLKAGETLELHYSAALKLAKGYFAGGHIWDYFYYKGYLDNEEQVSYSFLEKRLKEFEKFAPIANMFITEQEHPLETVNKFLGREQLFFDGLSTFLLLHGNKFPFEIDTCFWQPDCDNVLKRPVVGLGVYKNSPNKKAVYKFLEFLLSSQIQELIVTEMWDCPVRFSSALRFADIFTNTTARDIRKYYKSSPMELGFAANPNDGISNFLIFEIQDILHALMTGQIRSEQAVDIIFKRWKKHKH